MATISYRKKTAASEIQFFRNYDMAGGDLDGTDKASLDPSLLSPDGYNMFGDGFYLYPSSTGDVEVITYEDWRRNDKVIDDALAQVLPGLAGGIWHAIRVVKILAANTTVTNVLLGV